MLRNYLSLFFLLPFVPIIAQENNTSATPLENSLRIDPLRVALSDEEIYRWQISYERTLSENFAVLVAYEKGQFEVGTILLNTMVSEEYTISGDAFLIEGRYYPLKEKKVAPRGFFVGAYYKQYWLTENNQVSADQGRSFEKNHALSIVGLDAGYKFGKKCFLIEPVLGYGIASSTKIGEDKRLDNNFGNFEVVDYALRLGLNIGIFF